MYIIYFFFLCQVACRILDPNQGLNLGPAVRVPSPNHWTAREFPIFYLIVIILLFVDCADKKVKAQKV